MSIKDTIKKRRAYRALEPVNIPDAVIEELNTPVTARFDGIWAQVEVEPPATNAVRAPLFPLARMNR